MGLFAGEQQAVTQSR